MRILRYKRFWCLLLLPLAYGLVAFSAANPSTTEAVYSRGIYPLIMGTVGRITSLVPFSITQWLVILVPAALLAYIIFEINRMVRRRERWRDHLARLAATLACVAGVAYFVFVLFCGLNYHRERFAVHSGLHVRPSSAEELADLCNELVELANRYRSLVQENDEGVAVSAFHSNRELAGFARTVYDTIGDSMETLGGYTVTPKPVFFSRGMSYLDITGVFMPYTFEPNVNVDVPDFWIPSTTMHELAHSKGYMREDEANFISYVACLHSDHGDFQYSGALMALVHSTNALYATDRELYWPVAEQYSPGLRRDLDATSAYWKQFEGPVAEVSAAVNDTYLKSNKQASGVKSYGDMVDLLLADYRLRHGLE